MKILPRNTVLVSIACFLFACMCVPVRLQADMGAIHLHSSNVTVSEPAQKAIILHNGAEEILILETDLKASEKTEIVRFIPFPAEPVVSLAPENAIEEMGKLVQSKKLHYITYFQSKGGSGNTKNQPVAEVVSLARLGAHDVTVVKINDAEHFKNWVRNYFKKKKQLQSGPELEQVAKVAREYVKDAIPYFVFDCVTLDNADKSVAPVAFRFKSKKLYYPLRTSNTIGGNGAVQLFFLAIDCARQPFNNGFRRLSEGEHSGFQFSSIAEVKPEEAASIYPDIAAFFDGKRIVLQSASFSGALYFERDIHSFMLTHYDPMLYDTSGAVQPSVLNGTDFLPGQDHRVRRPNPIWNAETLERQRRQMMAMLANGSWPLNSTGGEVKFSDGSYRDGSMRVEIERFAFGDLNGDGCAAMITKMDGRGTPVCELTVFSGKRNSTFEQPALERVGSVLLKSDNIQDFSFADNEVKVIGKGGAVESFVLINGKITSAK